jgi:hypothetical protein
MYRFALPRPGMPGRQPDPHPGRHRDHDARPDVAKAPSTAAARAGSTAPSSRTRALSGSMTSRTVAATAVGVAGGDVAESKTDAAGV